MAAGGRAVVDQQRLHLARESFDDARRQFCRRTRRASAVPLSTDLSSCGFAGRLRWRRLLRLTRHGQSTLQQRHPRIARIEPARVGQFLLRRLDQIVSQAPFGQAEMGLRGVVRQLLSLPLVGIVHRVGDEQHLRRRHVDDALRLRDDVAFAADGDLSVQHAAAAQDDDTLLLPRRLPNSRSRPRAPSRTDNRPRLIRGHSIAREG